MFLSNKNKHVLDEYIKFDEGPHIYTIEGDSNYTSVTTWVHKHFPKFDSDKIINNMMKSKNWENNKYYGMTKYEIKNLWRKNGKEAACAGTKMHEDIEHFYNNIEPKNNSLEFSYFLKFHKKFSNLIPYRTEWMIYNKKHRLAGSVDMIFEKEDGTLEIYDWKRCKEITKVNNFNKFGLTEPVNHLPDSNYWHYCLQLNTYKYIIENDYGKNVSGMYLVCLHPNNKNKSYQRFKVVDLQKEIKQLLSL